MSHPKRNKTFQFRLMNPAYYLDALLFWSVYVSSTMLILWLLTSTAKNQIRKIIIEELVSIKIQTVELLEYERKEEAVNGKGKQPLSKPFHRVMGSVVKSYHTIEGMAVVKYSGNGVLRLVADYGDETYTNLDFTRPEHIVYLNQVKKEGKFTISKWEIFTSESATMMTPAPKAVEYLYAKLPGSDQEYLIIAFNAAAVQHGFYKMEEFGITSICLGILLATLISIFIRIRSTQRLKANEEKLAALESLEKRDTVLSLIVDAADKLLGQAEVEVVFRDLMDRIKSELGLYELSAVVDLNQKEVGQERTKCHWIHSGYTQELPVGFGGGGGLLPEWRDLLSSGKSLVVRRREAPAIFRAWMVNEGVERIGLVGMHSEGHLSGLIVVTEKKGDEIIDSGLNDALKLTADIFSAAYQQRMQENRMLESSKMEALGRMAGGVAHEFNNLLHIITGNLRKSHSADSGGGEQHQEECSEKILEAAKRGSQIVEQLLRATRLNVPNLQSGDLNAMIEKTVSLAKSAVGAGVSLETLLDADLPRVSMDEGQIQQVILNLILNARDAVNDHGRIEIKTGVKGGMVYCEVQDDGPGIPQKILGRLFEPFFTTKEPGKGTGLGLSTSRGIIDQHSGTMEVRNHVSGGAVFCFYLYPSLKRVNEVKEVPGEFDFVFEPAGRVLIADDEPMCREVLTECLAEKGIEVLSFTNGEDLLKYAEGASEKISWVISDWTMPGRHGVELVREIHRICPGTKIFVTSGFVLNPEEMPWVDGLINKPFGPEELFQVLATALVRDRK